MEKLSEMYFYFFMKTHDVQEMFSYITNREKDHDQYHLYGWVRCD